MGLPQPEGYLFWYTTSAVLGLLTLSNIASITLRWITQRSDAKRTLSQLASAPSSPTTSSRSGSLTSKEIEDARVGSGRQLSTTQRFSRAFVMGADKFIGLSTVPLPRLRWWVKRKQGNSIATVELAWTLVYSLGCLILSFYGSRSFSRLYSSDCLTSQPI
jgi:hypothetical protein